MDNREKKIKEGLNKEIYHKLDNIENLDDDTVSSNQKLSNILEGYVTRMDSIGVDDPDLTLEILNEEEIEIEVSLDGIEEEYNETLFKDDTNVLEPEEQITNFDDDIEFDTTSSMDETMSEIDEEVITSNKRVKKKFHMLDYILLITIVICLIIMAVVFR